MKLSSFENNKRIIRSMDLNDKKLLAFILISQIDPNSKLGIFGYGSLIWNPEFLFDCKTVSILPGYKRKFCLRAPGYRGTPESPGIGLGLVEDSNSKCEGMLFQFNTVDSFYNALLPFLEREIGGGFIPTWIDIKIGSEIFQSLNLINDTEWHRFTDISLEEQFKIISTASGSRGTNLEYLVSTANSLEELGIYDEDIIKLMKMTESLPA